MARSAVGRLTTVAITRSEQSAAAITPADIDAVFLTGGTTMIPEVRRRIVARLDGARVIDGDVFGSVGVGLGLAAQLPFPHSLGSESRGT